MAFAMMVNQLIPALNQPGCPICNLQRSNVQRFLETFLQENLMDREARQEVLDSLGFCPTHTFQLARMEMRNDGDPLGTVILHEHIHSQVQNALRKWQNHKAGKEKTSLGQYFRQQFGLKHAVAISASECQVCVGMRENSKRGLTALFDELGRGTAELVSLYEEGDGLCLGHLRLGLDTAGLSYPEGADYLVKDTLQRLEMQRSRMKEYIRKHNMTYRDEKITPEEELAWRQALGFHSGYEPGAFGAFSREPE